MKITLQEAAELLHKNDSIVILAHKKPDGDTLGCAFGLLFALQSMGKTARVECADGFPERYSFLFGDYVPDQFTPAFVVAVDVAGESLLGSLYEKYPKIDLCIDHHQSNSFYAAATLLEPTAAATAEMVYRLVREMGISPDRLMADALFTGITTDTGCFRFQNVTDSTHRYAAELIACGARHHEINKRMFDMKSPGRIEVEKLMMQSLELHFGAKCASVSLPADICDRFDVPEEELDGIAAFTRQIEGVFAGITIRANKDGSYRVSLRSEPPVDSSRICEVFAGGGHPGAAGCTLYGTHADVHQRLLDAVAKEFSRAGIL